MFISATDRKKNGKKHTYHRVMEKQRSALGQWVQQQVIYLGELTSDQEESWRRALQVFDPVGNQTQRMTLFATPDVVPPEQLNSVAIRLDQIKLHRPRSYGGCWLGCELWRQLQLDQFWHSRLKADGRSGVQWQKVLALLVINRLVAPGSEFRLHRQWFLMAVPWCAGRCFRGLQESIVSVSGSNPGTSFGFVPAPATTMEGSLQQMRLAQKRGCRPGGNVPPPVQHLFSILTP